MSILVTMVQRAFKGKLPKNTTTISSSPSLLFRMACNVFRFNLIFLSLHRTVTKALIVHAKPLRVTAANPQIKSRIVTAAHQHQEKQRGNVVADLARRNRERYTSLQICE